jgi:DNA/RNA-binding domain of Phe-tRNA-synthetase-like protein
LETRLAEFLEKRKGTELTEADEKMRAAARDMLRFQSYKPTGRGKPASEYLLKTTQEGTFPRINTLVDINNYISIKYILPISLWDLDKAGTAEYLFRPGKAEEEYVFNPSGQTISIADLICGYRVINGIEEAIVNPIKDSMRTKTDAETKNIGVSVYYPANQPESILQACLDEFEEVLKIGGATVTQKLILSQD